MYIHETSLRVRYSETDQMGYVYYGQYASYFEVARVEALRTAGISYKSLEESGIMMPVLEYSIRYLRPARYDEELFVQTRIPELPQSRIRFEYETYNIDRALLNRAHTELVFMDAKTRRPVRVPELVLKALRQYL